MASSFASQISGIIYLVTQLKPKTVLDVGKGFGKFGFLIHEYIGINNRKRLIPGVKLKDQSDILVDAVEVDADLILPHLPHIYNNVYQEDILQLYPTLKHYDVVMMIDVIEHLDKEKSKSLLKHFLASGSSIIIATPKHFFEQYLFESEYERHVSHWTIDDFKSLGYVCYLPHKG